MAQAQSTNRRRSSSGGLTRKSNFAKLNTEEVFKAVDVDQSGTIEFEEWMRFWSAVKSAGHSDKEIVEELECLRDGKAWVSFANVNPSKSSKN